MISQSCYDVIKVYSVRYPLMLGEAVSDEKAHQLNDVEHIGK